MHIKYSWLLEDFVLCKDVSLFPYSYVVKHRHWTHTHKHARDYSRTIESNTRQSRIKKYDFEKGSSDLFGNITFKMTPLSHYNQSV